MDYASSMHSEQLDRIERALASILMLQIMSLQQGAHLMADLTALEAQVRANTDAEDSAILLLNGLAAQLAAAATDPAKIASIAAELKASSERLSAAVVANTPAA